MQRYTRRLVGNARRLRSNSTDVERLLWRYLRGKQILGLRFYRQRPLLHYVVDFYCPEAKLVVELDGGQHFSEQGMAADSMRDRRIRKAGLAVLRFDNHAVLTDTAGVLETIRLTVMGRIPL